MSDASLNPALADWTNRAAKRHADELSFRGLAKWVMSRRSTTLEVLSLPAGLWLWEQSLSQIFPDNRFRFHGVEQNGEVHRLMRERAKKLKGVLDTCVSPKPESLTQWMQRNAGGAAVDLAYFDWMGAWSEDKVSQVRVLFSSGLLAAEGIFRFTVGLSRGKNSKWEHLMQDLDTGGFHITDLRSGRSDIPQWKIYGVPQLVINLASEYGRKAKLVGAHVYTSYRNRLGQGVPEASFTLLVK